ncbi:hypothetical protein, partial [Thermococcus sp.]|uniref:hypothetical protein n=1 Tax=Thermococcus sp. TaxID=35749 RepID=UPI002605A9BA
MRKVVLPSLVLLTLLLIFSSCAVPKLQSLSLENGTYVDPRKDLDISWNVANVPDGSVFYIYLNNEEIGHTSEMSYSVPSSYLDWGKSYELGLVVRGKDGKELFNASTTFYTYAGALDLYVVDANSGPAVEGAEIYLNGEDTELETGSDGEAEIMVKENPVNILLKKSGYALSAVENLEVSGEMNYKVLLRKAQMNPDPDSEELPSATVTFYTDDSKASFADLNDATSLYVVVKASGKRNINIIYASAGKIPGAGFFGKRLFGSATNTLEGYLDLSGLSGRTDIHIVVYDTNDNRVDYVFYANVEKASADTSEEEKYEVMKFSDFGYTNIDSYTRRREIEFYSLPVNPKEKRFKFDRVKRKLESAPKDSNLWVEVWFIDYDLAAYYGLIDPSSVEKPEAYVIYRSFDGRNWEKAGIVSDTDKYDVLFRDSDPRLAPGKKVYYKVAAYYPGG